MRQRNRLAGATVRPQLEQYRLSGLSLYPQLGQNDPAVVAITLVQTQSDG